MRSWNVCLTPELGADPGRVKDRIGGWRKEETGERQSPMSAPEQGKGGSVGGGVGIHIPSQGQTAIGFFSGVGAKETCKKTYNAE